MFQAHALADATESQSGFAAWVFSQKVTGSDRTMEQSLEALRQVTREQVIAAANLLKLDTIYILKATLSEDENGEEAAE